LHGIFQFMVNVGQRLYNRRIQKKLTLENAAEATKIKHRFLAALEKGEYHKLPSPAYAQGFVSTYAAYLGLPKSEIVALFRREFDEKKAYKVLPDSLVKQREFPLKRIRIQQSLYVVFCLLLLLGCYLLFQYRSVFLAPPLTITSPKSNVVTSQNITVSGKTDSDATVTVNDEPALLTSDGQFIKQITLFPGKTVLVIKAKNRMGKETIIKRGIEVK